MKKLFFLSGVLLSAYATASGSKAPKGYWQCSFTGQEWQIVPGPGGPQHELRLTTYASDWKKTRSEAYNEASSDCEHWSDGFCQFNSCRQKSR